MNVIVFLLDELEGLFHLDLTVTDEQQAIEVAKEMYPDAEILQTIFN